MELRPYVSAEAMLWRWPLNDNPLHPSKELNLLALAVDPRDITRPSIKVESGRELGYSIDRHVRQDRHVVKFSGAGFQNARGPD